ncbi:recombination protein RecR [Candidatus Uhrbacteria bacterium]|nr:recombination protein RecR [Candidatus Uhrbacteria bacterium]
MTNLVAAFARLPGVGPKTALRYVFYLLQQPKADLEVMARALMQLGERIQSCPRCFTYTESQMCEICLDPKRDSKILCVVEEARDISTIESTGGFTGLYHVLGGTLSPIEGITADVIRFRELKNRLETEPGIEEIILALSPTVQGETTILFLQKQFAPFNRTITRLARGLPLGATLEFADEVTLGDALKGRKRLT